MKKKILEIAKQNNGYVTRKKLTENNIPTINLTRLVKEGQLIRVYKGIYLLKGYIEDMFYIYNEVYSKIVYTRETALYLNGMSNRQFTYYSAALPFNTTTPKIKNFKFFKTRKETFNLGIEQVRTSYGNLVRCYDKERCICDLFIYDDYDYDYEDRVYAINEYINNYLDLEKLYRYARRLNIYSKVKSVFEVIGWN
ncbi:MAG: type IV toxin-antitoxin system AbiEi family antitoxin domain-containing protein [Bacilli bacterium]